MKTVVWVNRTRRIVWILSGLMLTTAVGCGTGPSGGDVDLAPAEGTVTVQGSPVMGVRVTAVPDKGPIAMGVTDANGQFALRTGGQDGVTVGNVRVAVAEAGGGPNNIAETYNPDEPGAAERAMRQYQEQYGPNRAGQSAQSPEPESAIPEKYTNVSTSGLNFEIKSGETNQLTIQLD